MSCRPSKSWSRKTATLIADQRLRDDRPVASRACGRRSGRPARGAAALPPDARVVGAADPDRAVASCSPGRSRDRTPSTTRTSPGRDGGSSASARPRRVSVPACGSTSCSLRTRPERPRPESSSTSSGRPRRSARRSPPATSGCSARPRWRRPERCATRSAKACSAASATPFASPASTSGTRRASTWSRSARRSSSRRRTGRVPSSRRPSAASASSSRRC